MIETWIASYGYIAVFVGALFEGETVLVAAGFAAHQGLLQWSWVVLVAFLGATLGDQLAFLLGRWRGPALIARVPVLARRAPQVHRLLERYDVVLILGVRFLYGLRIAGPVIIGTSGVPTPRFMVFNALGAAIWAPLITGAGYYFGMALKVLFAGLREAETAVLIAILAGGFLYWLWRRRRSSR